MTWEQWIAGNYAIELSYAGQMIVQPLAWLVILLWRVRNEDIGAAEYHAA